jgi:hypothetical protein
MIFIVDIEPTSDIDFTLRGNFGHTSLLPKPVNCKFKNEEKFTGSGSISKMVTHGVSSGEPLGHAQHKSV